MAAVLRLRWLAVLAVCAAGCLAYPAMASEAFLPSRGMMAHAGLTEWTTNQIGPGGKRVISVRTAPVLHLTDFVTGGAVEDILVGSGIPDVAAFREPDFIRLQGPVVVGWPYQQAGAGWRLRLFLMSPDLSIVSHQLDLDLPGVPVAWKWAVSASHAGVVAWTDDEGDADVSYWPGIAWAGDGDSDATARSFVRVPACGCSEAQLAVVADGGQVFVQFAYGTDSGDTSIENVWGGQDMPVPIVTRIRVKGTGSTAKESLSLRHVDLVGAVGGQAWIVWDDGSKISWRAADGSGSALSLPSGGDDAWNQIRAILAQAAPEP